MGDRDCLIAWAAGLYDGEGSSSAYLPPRRATARQQIQISQAGNGTHPEVLVRFREIVGGGNITGPYRGYLYYWKTTRKDAIDGIVATLWPYLSAAKRSQLDATGAAAGRHYSGPTIRDRATEAAWAAGFFDAEGSLWITKDERYRPDWRGVSMEIAQASADGIPETLLRFDDIVAVGHITGPRSLRNPWSRLPQYRWRASGRHTVSAAVTVLWPWLSTLKRTQISAAAAHLDPGLAM